MYNSIYKQTIPYLGAKLSVLPWLLPNLPQCYHFVELFSGSGVVTVNRIPSPIETLNDLNGEIANFFMQLRDNGDRLIQLLDLTPHSRQEYNAAFNLSAEDSGLERARKYFVRCRSSFLATGGQQKKGWAASIRVSRTSMSDITSKWMSTVYGLTEVVKRLKMVQIENRSYEWVVGAYDTKNTLFYADPPYDPEMRSSGKDYFHEFTLEDHHKLKVQLSSIAGKAAVSGYDSEFMKDLYQDWNFVSGPIRKTNLSQKKVRECLWTNYDPKQKNTLF